MLSTQASRIKSLFCQWLGNYKHPLRGLCKYVRGGAAQHSTHEVINSGRPTMSIHLGNIILEHIPVPPALATLYTRTNHHRIMLFPIVLLCTLEFPPLLAHLPAHCSAGYWRFPLQMHIVECQLACNYMYDSAESASGAFGLALLCRKPRAQGESLIPGYCCRILALLRLESGHS